MFIFHTLFLHHFYLLNFWRRFNQPFTRRLKRKSVAGQKYCFNAKPQWVIAAFIRLKVFMPAAGVRTISNNFNGIYRKRETVSKSFVAKVLRNHRYAIAMQRREMRNRKPIGLLVNAI